MPNAREVKRRIKGISETKKITRAMKLISAAKLKRARQQLDQTLPYFDKVKSVIADIFMHSQDMDNIFFHPSNPDTGVHAPKRGFLVLTGDRGLAGGYNMNLIKLAEKTIANDKSAMLFIAGQLGRTYFLKKGYNVRGEFEYPVQNPSVFRAREMAEEILELFRKKELDEVTIVYTLMISTLKLEPRTLKILPIDPAILKNEVMAAGAGSSANDKWDATMVYEPSPQAVFDILIPKYLKGIIYGTLVEAFTSEQSARMTSMDNATANAEDMLQRLNLLYNRTRQAVITREISEIVGGAAAIE